MSASSYAELKILDHSLGTAEWTMPSAVYIGLFSSDPTDAGTGTELSGNGYARAEITFAAASNGSAANDSQIDFDAATDDWATATHFGIFDAATSGNLLYHGQLNTPRAAETGQQVRVPIGEIVITAD